MSFVQARPRATHDLYAQVHKGLRLSHSRLLIRLGACGGDDAQETAELMADLRAQLEVADHHLAREEIHIHVALEARAPGASAALHDDHEHHRRAFAELAGMIDEVERADPLDRAGRLMRLYLAYSLFVGEDLVHMAFEEQQILPVLQGLFTDDELIEIEAGILCELSPDELMELGAMMVPAATRAERAAMLRAVKAVAPPDEFIPILGVTAESTLSDSDYAHLRRSLGVE